MINSNISIKINLKHNVPYSTNSISNSRIKEYKVICANFFIYFKIISVTEKRRNNEDE